MEHVDFAVADVEHVAVLEFAHAVEAPDVVAVEVIRDVEFAR